MGRFPLGCGLALQAHLLKVYSRDIRLECFIIKFVTTESLFFFVQFSEELKHVQYL